jgi:hypothetical protein
MLSIQTEGEGSSNVNAELAFLDEYSDVKARTRKLPEEKNGKKKKTFYRRAEDLCRIRDEQVKVTFIKFQHFY